MLQEAAEQMARRRVAMDLEEQVGPVRVYLFGEAANKVAEGHLPVAKTCLCGTDGSGNLDRNPAVKILDFYRSVAAAHEAGRSPIVFDVDRAKARSPAIRTARAVTPELMVHWCKQWGF